MDENPHFSQRNNAKRAAEKMIAAGTAPAVDYGIRTRDDGRFEIAWHTSVSPVTAPVETEIPSTAVIPASFDDATGAYIGSDEYERDTTTKPAVDAAQENSGSVAHEQAQPDPTAWPDDNWPAGTRVKLTGTIVERVEADYWRIRLDEAPSSIGVTAAELAAGTRQRSPVAKPGTERRMSKTAEFDARAARGEMPNKPDVTSHANHHYQKRFDRLTEFAASGDWDAVRAYECNGINSYAKQVRQYRDRLLAANAAQQASTTETA
jgi:hypothetical protein